MSSKDNKPDLSNLKSRLGLKKPGGGPDKSSGDAKNKTTGSGGQSALTGSGPQRTGAKSGGGGVDDRLAALKKSKLKSKREPEPVQQAQAEVSAPSAAEQPTSSGGFDEFSAAAQPQQSSAAAQPGGAAPRQAGPPPGAQGPPPTAMAPPKQQRQAATSTGQQFGLDDDEEIDLKDFDLDDGGIFSPATVVVMVVVAVLGLMFGFFTSDSLDARAIQQSRIDDAKSLQADLEPKIEDFERAREIIRELANAEHGEIDFDAARELAELDFVINARVLPRERMLMADRSIVGPLNQAMGNTDALFRLILEHYQITTGVDREELEALAEGFDDWSPEEELAVRFSLQGWGLHMQDPDQPPYQFNPSPGSLVRAPVRPDFDIEEEAQADDPRSRFEVDDEGMIRVEYVSPGEYGEPGGTENVAIYDIVPVNRAHFLDVERNNALQRYEHRVKMMGEYTDQLARQLTPLQDAIDSVASESVPLFSIGGTVDAPATGDDDGAINGDEAAEDDAAE